MAKLRALAASAAAVATAGLLASAPVAAHAATPGASVVVVTGTNHSIYYYQTDTQRFTDLGGQTNGTPVVMVTPGNVVYVLVTGTNRHLYIRTTSPTDNWQRADAPTTACGQPGLAMVSGTAGGTIVAAVGCRGTSGALYYSSTSFTEGQHPVWSTFRNLSGQITGGPALAAPHGNLSFYVTGTAPYPAHNIYYRTLTAGYTALAYSSTSSPAAAVDPTTGDVYLTWRQQHGLPAYSVNNGPMTSLPDGHLVRTPGISASSSSPTAPSVVTIFGQGTSGGLYERTVLPTLGAWRYDGGSLLAGASAATFH